MERLSGLDASFLYAETPETPTHTALLWIFEPPSSRTNVFAAFRDRVRASLHLLPFFHRKLVMSPIQLDHPVWIEDDEIDFDYHVRHVALPKPGTEEQLHTLVTRLHMVLLDRARPLWQFYVIDGLKDGHFAIYAKLHHAAVDGGAAMVIVEKVLDDSAEPTAALQPRPVRKEAAPNLFELISTSYASFFRQQQQFFQSWPEIGKAAVAVGRRMANDVEQRQGLPLAPKTIFNAPVSNQRALGVCTLSLSEAKALGKAFDATLNDVVMAVSAGALRRYLQTRDALPAESLVAGVPVSLREAGNTDVNNQVTTMLCRLATDVDDPVERLRVVEDSSRDAKARLSEFKDVMSRDVAWLGAPILMTSLARLSGQAGVQEMLPPMANVLISNVPGPRKTKYCAGGQMIHFFPVSGIGHGTALNITLISYLDQLEFGLIACRNAVPDPGTLARLIVEEFGVLKGAAAQAKAASRSNVQRNATGESATTRN